MMTSEDWFNLVFGIMGFTVALLGLLQSLTLVLIDKSIKKHFIAIFTILVFYTASDLISQFSTFHEDHSYMQLSILSMFAESLFVSLLMPILSHLILSLCKEDPRKSSLMLISVALFSVYLFMLIYNLFDGVFFYFTYDNVYNRGEYYSFLLVPPVLLMMTNVIGLIKRWNNLSRNDRKALAVYLTIPIICMIVQMFFYGVLLIVIGTCVSAFAMFWSILTDQTGKIRQQETDLLLTEMKPHFIYNTMTNIYYLCDIDTEKAKSVINSFTTYLRGNYTALCAKEPVPFEQELRLTKAYLEVIKARYEDLIFVEYDIEHKDFDLPSLTLEPIVENCVKHGVDPEQNPLHICIRTSLEGRTNVITVTNDGVAYSPAEDDEIHIGLDSVRGRLKMMCNGTLDISAGENNNGTVVTIRV